MLCLNVQGGTNCNRCTHNVSQKNPTFKLSLTLSNLNRFSKFLHCWNACKICYKTDTTLSNSPQAYCYTTLGYQKFKFSANIQQIWKKCKQIAFSVHRFQFLYACNCVCCVCLCVFIKILSSSLNTMLIVDKHCSDVCYDEFPVPQIDHKNKQVREE